MSKILLTSDEPFIFVIMPIINLNLGSEALDGLGK